MEQQSRPVTAEQRAIQVAVSVAMLVLIVASLHFIYYFASAGRETVFLKQMIATVGMAFATALFIACCVNMRENSRQGHIFLRLSALLFIIILLAGISDSLEGVAVTRRALYIIEIAICVISLWINWLFWRYQCASLPKTRRQRGYTYAVCLSGAIYLVMLIVNLFTGFLFYVDAAGNTHWSGEALDAAVLLLYYALYLAYVLPQRCSRKKKFALTAFAICPLAVVALSILWYLRGNQTTVQSLLYNFLLLAAYVVFFCDYRDSQERLLEQKAELAELQSGLVLSQIRPHFLYNALTAIRDLCVRDPQQAYQALGRFSDYLRGNMDTLGGGRIIPFETELEHIRTYLMLERLRFEDALRVEYDIQYTDFSLPTLTVQPIVENAVRHGATANEDGGTVTIRSVMTEQGAEITVTDDGPGFDPAVIPADGRTHLGIANVRACLAASGCGEMRIDSRPGSGTTVTIQILEKWGG